MANPADCKVCFFSFTPDGSHRPRTLPCGHTLCSPCITNLLGNGSGRLICPTCRTEHTGQAATHFPVNYGMEALIQLMRSQVEGGGKRSEERELEEDQEGELSSEVELFKDRVLNLMVECGSIKAQLHCQEEQLTWPQAQHSALLTRMCDLVGENKDAVMQLSETQGRCRELLKEGQGIAAQLEGIVELLESVESVREKRHAVNLAKVSIQDMKLWKRSCEGATDGQDVLGVSVQVLEATREALKQLATEKVPEREAASSDVSAIHLSSVLQRVQLSLQQRPPQHTLTTGDLQQMVPGVRQLLEGGRVYGVNHEVSGDSRSARLTLENGHLHLYHLSDTEPRERCHIYQVSNYLSTPHTTVLTFLDLAWGGQLQGRVYIRLDLDTPLARQFLLLCSGRQGYTHAGTSLIKVCGLRYPGEFIVGGDYASGDGNGGAALLPDLRGDYKKTGLAGSIWGRWEVESKSAQFAITTIGCKGVIPRVFGCVESGLRVVQAAAIALCSTRVTVQECGVVLHL